MRIRLPKSYANLAETMMFENQALADEGWSPMELPHKASDIEGAWKTWITEGVMTFDGWRVPEHFLTDFASIPRVLRWLFDPNGAPWQIAAVAHDYLYSSTGVSRKYADRYYLDIALEMGTSRWMAWAQYLALRVGGAMAFRSNRKKMELHGSSWRVLKSVPGDWKTVYGGRTFRHRGTL